jgi:hypothetical protein
MTNRMYATVIASVSAVALICAAGETFAGAPRAGVSSAHPHSHFRPHVPFARHFRHHRFNNNNNFIGGVFWPDSGFNDTPTGGPGVDLPQPIPNDIRNTNAFDIPWDWAHRYPPMVTPSNKPYVTTCPTETIKVPNRNGGDQTINITRCY